MSDSAVTTSGRLSPPADEVRRDDRGTLSFADSVIDQERPLRSWRIRLAIAGLVLAHVVANCVLAACPLATPTFMVHYTLHASEVVLLSLWLVVGSWPLPLRGAIFVAAIANSVWFALWLTPNRFGLSDSWYWMFYAKYMAVVTLLTVAGLWRPRVGIRCHRRANGLATIELMFSLSQPKLSLTSLPFRERAAPVQFSLRHIFYACTAVAAMLMVSKPLLMAIAAIDDYSFDYVQPGLIGIASIWAGLSIGWPLVRCLPVVLLAALLGECYAEMISTELRVDEIGANIGQALIIIGSLFVLRACGYRLVRDDSS